MVRFGVPGQNINSLAYTDERLAGVPVVQAPRRPTVNDKEFPIWCEWRTNKDAQSPAAEGEFWKLIRFESNGDATWVRYFSDGVSTGVVDIRDQVGTDVTVDPVTGKIDIDASIVATGSNPSAIPFETVADAGTHTLDLKLQLAGIVTPTPADTNDVGVCSFNTNQFTKDATSGMISLAGGGVNPPILKFDVDSNTPPGTDPVIADVTGMLTVAGALVAAHSVPIETYSRATSAYNIEVQRSTVSTDAAKSANNAGLLSANSAQFQMDATTGFLSLKGSTSLAPILSLTGSGGGGALSPDANGNVTLAGSTGVTVTGSGSTITITGSGTGGGLTWREETGTSANFATDEGVFANNAGTVTLTLPAAPSVGDTFAAYQEGVGKVRVQTQGADIIKFGTTSSAAGGYIESLNEGDCVTVVAIDATRFRVINSVGSWTVSA